MSEVEVRQCKDNLAPAHRDRAPEDQPAVQAGHPGLDEAPPSDMLVNIIAELLIGRSDAASILAAAATPASLTFHQILSSSNRST